MLGRMKRMVARTSTKDGEQGRRRCWHYNRRMVQDRKEGAIPWLFANVCIFSSIYAHVCWFLACKLPDRTSCAASVILYTVHQSACHAIVYVLSILLQLFLNIALLADISWWPQLTYGLRQDTRHPSTREPRCKDHRPLRLGLTLCCCCCWTTLWKDHFAWCTSIPCCH